MWQSRTEPTIADDLENAKDLEESAATHAQEHQRLRESLIEAKAQADKRESELRQEAQSQDRLRALCEQKLAELAAQGAVPIPCPLASQLAELETATLASRWAENMAALADARARRDASLAKCHHAFRAHPNSPADEFWNATKLDEPTHASLDAKDAYWCEAYRGWHEDGASDGQIKTISAEAESFGGLALDFLRSLDRFQKGCEATGREISAGLKTLARNATQGSNRFKAVSDLKIRIECDLASLPFHSTLALAAAEHEAWRESNEPTPPEHHLRTLAKLMEYAKGGEGLCVALQDLVGVSGSVVEVGQFKRFSTKQAIGNLSSNGLSYLIVLMVQLAFLNQARAECPNMRAMLSVDELRDLDNANTLALFELLAENKVDLLCAFPEPDAEILENVANLYWADTDGSLRVFEAKESMEKSERARRKRLLAAGAAARLAPADAAQTQGSPA